MFVVFFQQFKMVLNGKVKPVYLRPYISFVTAVKTQTNPGLASIWNSAKNIVDPCTLFSFCNLTLAVFNCHLIKISGRDAFNYEKQKPQTTFNPDLAITRLSKKRAQPYGPLKW